MILIDTTPLVGLSEPRAAHHRVATRQLQHLGAQPLAFCEAVLAECCFHLRGAQQRRRLRGVLEEFSIRLLPTSSDSTFHDEVFDWLDRYSEHAPDWADAVLAVLCGRDHQLSVWTFDREFHTHWRRPDGSRIPLAIAFTS